MAKLFGLEVPDLPDDLVATELVVIVKTMSADLEDGFPYMLASRCTSGLSIWEAEGMVRWAVISCEDQLADMAKGAKGDD